MKKKVKFSFSKVRFITSLAAIYLLTIGLIGYALSPAQLFSTPVHAEIKKTAVATPHKPAHPRFIAVSGKPIRITIPDYGIDLPIDDGYYDPTTTSWNTSETHAQFATISTAANNHTGTTFIYGHGTDAVFGKIGSLTPLPGTVAKIYTDNNHVFSYKFKEANNLTPTDTSLFDTIHEGSPQLTIQTCTGVFSEWRTMFQFTFERVEQ